LVGCPEPTAHVLQCPPHRPRPIFAAPTATPSWRQQQITHLQALVANQPVADQEAALTNLPPDFFCIKTASTWPLNFDFYLLTNLSSQVQLTKPQINPDSCASLP
jgi:hypothetical protein